MSLLKELQQRGLVQDISDNSAIEKLLDQPPLTFYCGFDPTASSLHVGSLLPITVMRRLQQAGHKPLALVGSSTAMIGDPSGKSEERLLLEQKDIDKNISGIQAQLKNLLEFSGENPCTLVKNDSWLNNLSMIEFLRDTGKHFSVNSMISKDSVRSRLENREQGISYTEFSYMLLQSYDFYHLWKDFDCRLQIGGSDQWGNITEGIDLIRRQSKHEQKKALGFTFPLLTTSTGAKLGKTEQGAIWLDAERTSPYQFYQYWINLADQDATRLFKMLSFRSLTEINQIIEEHAASPQNRLAQTKLAEELTCLVHGQEELDKAKVAAKVFFGEAIADLPTETLLQVFSDVPSSDISKSELEAGIKITDLLVHCQLEKSKSAARRLVDGGGIYLNNLRVSDSSSQVTLANLVDQKLLVIRSGKKKYHLVKLI